MAIEIELRARVTREQADLLSRELARTSSVTHQMRCFIDYSTFIEGIGERKLDVRVRVTNGTPEIVVKRGKFGGASREEAIAPIAQGGLEGVLSTMALLGYTKGVAGGRKIVRGMIGPVELAIQAVLDFKNPTAERDWFVEVEYMGDATNTSEAEDILRSFLTSKSIEAFTPEAWNAFVKQLNDTWNGVFVHGETPVDVIRTLGRAQDQAH